MAVPKAAPVVKLPAAKQRNPYVLVLIDGDGYIVSLFCSHIIARIDTPSSTMNSFAIKKRVACGQPGC